jgi:DNA invertase Pin-like site-specific DNA recombinase
MRFFYYSRVSTAEQNLQRQFENFKLHGHLNAENLFAEKIKGNVHFFERPEAAKLFDTVTAVKGEPATVVIDSIDRLGRNLIDILNTIEVFKTNRINIKSLKEGFEILLPDGCVNPMALMLTAVMGSVAQMERERTKIRQREGIAVARANGTYKGRKVGSFQSRERLFERHPVIVKKLKAGLKVRDIAKITQNSTATVCKVKKALQHELDAQKKAA